MLSRKRILSGIFVALLLFTNHRSVVSPLQLTQLQTHRHRGAQKQDLHELFDDNNFEQEFVDTTNDHDTLPLNQQATVFEDDSATTSSKSSTDKDIAQIASLVGADVSQPIDSADAAQQQLTVKNTMNEADEANNANVWRTSSSSSADDAVSGTGSGSSSSSSIDVIEESVTEQAAKAKKAADLEDEKMEELKEKQEKATQAANIAMEKAKLEQKVAKDTAKEIKQIKKKIQKAEVTGTKTSQKKLVPEDAFADKKPKITVSRDPILVEKDMEEDQKLKKSVDKINVNIVESKKALEKHSAHVKELKELVKQQNEDSAAKAELDNVLKNAEKHVTDLELHIKKGEQLVETKEKSIEKIERKLNSTNQVDRAQAKVLKVDKKLIKEEKKDKACKESKKEAQKPIAQVSIKSIQKEAKKANKAIGKNKVKALKAQSAAKQLLPEVKKAKLQVQKLEALTAQTKEGSAREEKMKNITAKAKERLAVVEKKVNKQLTKEMKAKSDMSNAISKLEKSKVEMKDKKEDLKNVQEAKLAAQGKIQSRPGAAKKPDHVVEGENAIKYLKYVNQSADAYTVYHRTPVDPREWRNPLKEEKEPKYDIEEDDDPKLYNNKHPENSINQGTSTHSKKKVKKSKTVVMPKKYEKAEPKVYDAESSEEAKEEEDEDEEEKPIKVPAIVQKKVAGKHFSADHQHNSPRQLNSGALHPLTHMQPPVSVSHHASKHKSASSSKHSKKKRSHKKHKKSRKHHKRSSHQQKHKTHKSLHGRHNDGLTQTQSNIAIAKKVHLVKQQQPPKSKSSLSKEQLMDSPEIKKIIDNNNKFQEELMDNTLSSFKKNIEKMQKLYQKDKSEVEKEHKAFLKKIKKSEK